MYNMYTNSFKIQYIYKFIKNTNIIGICSLTYIDTVDFSHAIIDVLNSIKTNTPKSSNLRIDIDLKTRVII